MRGYPYLMQRLNPPHPQTDNPLGSLQDVFSFGCGLRNGGLSKGAMQILKPLFSFDYMGAAEFEFGALPQAFSAIAKDISSYKLSEVTISPQWKYRIYPKVRGRGDMKEAVYTDPVTLYLIVRTIQEDLIKSWFKKFEGNEYGSAGVSLKECLCISQAIIEKRHLGWICVDEDMEFMAFVDKPTFEKTAALFGLKG